jgi:hypothetical protein
MVGSLGKCFVTVETNFYPFGYRYNLGRNLSQGACLAAVALLLGFPRAFIPSSHSYRHLHPLGSHPLTDPLWSSDSVTIVHDGAEVERNEKLRSVCRCESALANLRVCLDDMNVNCGKCGKCLRTMIDLRLLGACPGPFPPLTSTGIVRKMLVLDDGEVVYLKAHLALANRGNDKALRRALSVCHSKSALVRGAIRIDKELLGGMTKRALRTVRPDYGIRRINATPME